MGNSPVVAIRQPSRCKHHPAPRGNIALQRPECGDESIAHIGRSRLSFGTTSANTAVLHSGRPRSRLNPASTPVGNPTRHRPRHTLGRSPRRVVQPRGFRNRYSAHAPLARAPALRWNHQQRPIRVASTRGAGHLTIMAPRKDDRRHLGRRSSESIFTPPQPTIASAVTGRQHRHAMAHSPLAT